MMRLDENLFEAVAVVDEFAPYSIIAHEINLNTNRYNKTRVAKRDTLEAAEELAKIVAERISDVQARNYVSIVDNDGEEVDTISGPYNSDINPNIDDLIESFQVSKDEYLRDAAELSWETGHTFDPDDFSSFKRVCAEDGYDVTEEDFQKYQDYFEECRPMMNIIQRDNQSFGPWQEMESKQVEDSDSFMTDYIWYVKDNNDGSETHIMIFGDKDVYHPLNSEPDAEFDSEELAREWFDNYKGFAEDLDKSLDLDDEDELNLDWADADPTHPLIPIVLKACEELGVYSLPSTQGGQGIDEFRSLSDDTVLYVTDYEEECDFINELTFELTDPFSIDVEEEQMLVNEIKKFIQNHPYRNDLEEAVLVENSEDELTMRDVVKQIVDRFGNYKYQYNLKAEEYTRYGFENASVYNKKFLAPNNYLALFSMYLHKAPTVANLEEYFDPDELLKFFEKNPTFNDLYDHAQSVWWGDGDDFIISVDNLTTGENLYEAEYEDLSYSDDDNDYDFDDEELDEAINSEAELVNGYKVFKADSTNTWFVMDGQDYHNEAEFEGKGYPTKEQAIERANSLEKGSATTLEEGISATLDSLNGVDLDAELEKAKKTLKVAKLSTQIEKQKAKASKQVAKQAKNDLNVTKSANKAVKDMSNTDVALSKDDLKIAKNNLKTAQVDAKLKDIEEQERIEEGVSADIVTGAVTGGTLGQIFGSTPGGIIGVGIGAVGGLIKSLFTAAESIIKHVSDKSKIKKTLKNDSELKIIIDQLKQETGETATEKVLTWIEDYYKQKSFNTTNNELEEAIQPEEYEDYAENLSIPGKYGEYFEIDFYPDFDYFEFKPGDMVNNYKILGYVKPIGEYEDLFDKAYYLIDDSEYPVVAFYGRDNRAVPPNLPDKSDTDDDLEEAIKPNIESEELKSLAQKHNIKVLDAMDNGDLRMEGAGADLMKFYQEAEKLGLWEVAPELYQENLSEAINDIDFDKILAAAKDLGKSDSEIKADIEKMFDGNIPQDAADMLTDTFFNVAKDVGINSGDDYRLFLKYEVNPGETLTQAIIRYRDEVKDLDLQEKVLQESPMLNIDKETVLSKIKCAKNLVKENRFFEASNCLVTAQELLSQPISEGVMSDFALEISEAGGKQNWKDLAQAELLDMRDSLNYLKTYAPKEVGAGGTYDSIKELEDDIADLEKSIKTLQTKLDYIMSVSD